MDKSRELLDAVNALAFGVTSLAEVIPPLIETLEEVAQQFSVIIAMEAERRNTNTMDTVQKALANLGQLFTTRGKRG